ncbi:hypothetical protein GCM10022268_16110 [Sphingomonas cynarae]|uniref:Surface antigen domain-containing protein n=1 Tax=Sphingomonas cynarae TaxID=930197 RepID=A0ABP7DN25_9SPHN
MDDDIPAWLPVPYRQDPEMQRHERSWTLMAGSHRLSFTRVDHYAVSRSRPRPAVIGTAPVRRWSLTGAVAVVLGSVAGMATLGLAMNASRAATGHYLVSIAVPDKIPFRIDRRSQASAARTVARQPMAAKPIAPAPTVAMAVPIEDEILPATAEAPLRLEARQPAIAAALRTGTMQQWTSVDGAERGFVVAGPMDRGCRTLSILTRRDGDSDVRTQRECMAATDDRATTP